MIDVPYSWFFAIYIGFILVLIAVTQFFARRMSGRVLIQDRDLFNCPVCAYCYIINRVDRMHKCPQCGSFNKKG